MHQHRTLRAPVRVVRYDTPWPIAYLADDGLFQLRARCNRGGVHVEQVFKWSALIIRRCGGM